MLDGSNCSNVDLGGVVVLSNAVTGLKSSGDVVGNVGVGVRNKSKVGCKKVLPINGAAAVAVDAIGNDAKDNAASYAGGCCTINGIVGAIVGWEIGTDNGTCAGAVGGCGGGGGSNPWPGPNSKVGKAGVGAVVTVVVVVASDKSDNNLVLLID